jgi:asparagine synthase (glutamine-hydrolysing)
VGADPLRSHVWWRSVFTPEDKGRLFDLEFIESNSGLDLNSLDPYRKIFDSHTDFDDLNKLMICDLYRFLGDNANILMDNFSMMHSIEARPPFLNKELAKIAMNINSNRKIGLLKGKKILRESVQSDLPKNIKRQKKAGLVAPQSKWLRNELKPLLEETRSELKNSLPFMNSKYVDEIFDDHLTGKSNNSLQVNAVITLNYWLKEF